ncbi:mechanosensitive ion channel family protein [Nesterenkonia aerolata]|uniref:Mechanosensitive ion channel family protein n=1 Tax=Nesterenkonia aerolata TaxID=3074079 RepID=A0ABU2DRF8_9MICC|nr:mechanosensitive ion channel family protein [Nesterenkonia sp. LY-0111]MDR8019066.1 mechanosensitive ion channel family protein [Nesterenkonia sp. LY-0111]
MFPAQLSTMLAVPQDNPTETAEEMSDIVEENVPDGVQALIADVGPTMGLLIGVGISAVFAFLVMLGSAVILRQIFRKMPSAQRAVNRTRIPAFVTVTLIGSRLALGIVSADHEDIWFLVFSYALLVGIVVCAAWWALRVVGIVEAVILARFADEEKVDDRRSRRVQTQVSLIRRVMYAIIVTIAVAAVLLMIPQVQALGAGLLASAGVISVVAGLAVQSTLTNVFAGVQLAFTDAIRVGDVIIMEDVYGVIEDITLSAVVVKIWDERRVIYPSSHFTTVPFENWTRVGTEMMGTVDITLYFRAPMDEIRARLKRLLNSTTLWDGKEYSVQVSKAESGVLQARCTVSARNSADLWDLQCLVREDMVNFLRHEHPHALLATRMVLDSGEEDRDGRLSVRTGQFGAVPEGGARGTQPQYQRYDLGRRDDRHSWPTDTREFPSVPHQDTDEYEFVRRYGTAADPSAYAEDHDTPLTRAGEGASLFTGSISAVERNREFGGPGEEAYRERREWLEEHYGTGEVDTPEVSAEADAEEITPDDGVTGSR